MREFKRKVINKHWRNKEEGNINDEFKNKLYILYYILWINNIILKILNSIYLFIYAYNYKYNLRLILILHNLILHSLIIWMLAAVDTIKSKIITIIYTSLKYSLLGIILLTSLQNSSN